MYLLNSQSLFHQDKLWEWSHLTFTVLYLSPDVNTPHFHPRPTFHHFLYVLLLNRSSVYFSLNKLLPSHLFFTYCCPCDRIWQILLSSVRLYSSSHHSKHTSPREKFSLWHNSLSAIVLHIVLYWFFVCVCVVLFLMIGYICLLLPERKKNKLYLYFSINFRVSFQIYSFIWLLQQK